MISLVPCPQVLDNVQEFFMRCALIVEVNDEAYQVCADRIPLIKSGTCLWVSSNSLRDTLREWETDRTIIFFCQLKHCLE